MADRHKPEDKPKAVRMPGGLLERVKTAAETDGASVNGFIVAAIEEKLERREGGSTAPTVRAKSGSTTRKPKAALAVPFVEPAGPRRCTHPGKRVIGGYCGECDRMIEPGGLWKAGA